MWFASASKNEGSISTPITFIVGDIASLQTDNPGSLVSCLQVCRDKVEAIMVMELSWPRSNVLSMTEHLRLPKRLS